MPLFLPNSLISRKAFSAANQRKSLLFRQSASFFFPHRLMIGYRACLLSFSLSLGCEGGRQDGESWRRRFSAPSIRPAPAPSWLLRPADRLPSLPRGLRSLLGGLWAGGKGAKLPAPGLPRGSPLLCRGPASRSQTPPPFIHLSYCPA